MLLLLGLALATEPDSSSVDWTAYRHATRRLCKTVNTGPELATLLYAQLLLMNQAQMAIMLTQLQFVDLLSQVHVSRLATGLSHERDALAADATITVALQDLRDEAERMGVRVESLHGSAQAFLEPSSARDESRRGLRRQCRDSFETTHEDVQKTIDVLLLQRASVSQISFDQLFALPPA